MRRVPPRTTATTQTKKPATGQPSQQNWKTQQTQKQQNGTKPNQIVQNGNPNPQGSKLESPFQTKLNKLSSYQQKAKGRVQAESVQNQSIPIPIQVENQKYQANPSGEPAINPTMKKNISIQENLKKSPSKPVLSLEMVFSETEKHLRSTIRELLKEKEYNRIDFCFEDQRINIKDCLLFQPQQNSLCDLTFRFAKTNDFEEDSLDFLKYLPLKCLTTLKLIFVITRNFSVKTQINYIIFSLKHIQNIKIYFISIEELQNDIGSLVPVFSYSKEKEEIPITFFRFNTLTKIDIEVLEILLDKHQPKSLFVTLDGKPQTNKQAQESWLQQLGSVLSSIEYLSLNFNNCLLNAQHIKSFIDGLIYSKSNGTSSAATNQTIKSLKLNYLGCSGIGQSFFSIIKDKFKALEVLELTFDKEKQIFRQYEQYFAFGFTNHFSKINSVTMKVNEKTIVYQHNKEQKSTLVSLKNMQISPFQLIDVKRSVNQNSMCEVLSCDLSDNFKLSFKNILRFFDEIVAIKKKNVKQLTVDLRNTNISEIESICIYLNLIDSIPNENLEFYSDVEIKKLLAIVPKESIFLYHTGETVTSNNPPFQWKVHFVFNQLMKLSTFKKVHIQFFYNYRITADLIKLHLIPFIINNKDLATLILDFNHCCLDHREMINIISVICDAVKTILSESASHPSERNFTLNLLFLNNLCPEIEGINKIFQEQIVSQQALGLKSFNIITDEYQFEKITLNRNVKQPQKLPDQIVLLYPYSKKLFKIDKKKQLIPKKLYLGMIAPQKEPLDFSIQSLQECDDEDKYINDEDSKELSRQDQSIIEFTYPQRERALLSTTITKEAIIDFDPIETKQKVEAALKEMAVSFKFNTVHLPESFQNYETYQQYYQQVQRKR